jgi:hypothetical protein
MKAPPPLQANQPEVSSSSPERSERDEDAPLRRHIGNAMVKVIARAFRWRDMLESGEYATIREIANTEKINERSISVACST